MARPFEVDYNDGHAWFVVRTNPRCERRAMMTLGERGFDTFLPMGKKELVHHRSGKRIDREFPLMIGYLFLAMPVASRFRHWGFVRECHGVRSVLGASGAPFAVPVQEVDALREAHNEGRLVLGKTRPSFVAGQEARISFGPFAGFVGQISDPSSMKAIRLLINIFGRLTELSMSVDELEPV